MDSSSVCFTLFLLLLVANSIDARKGPGERRKYVMKDKPRPKETHSLVHTNSMPSVKDKKHKRETPVDNDNGLKEKSIVRDFEPRTYADDSQKKLHVNGFELAAGPYADDSEAKLFGKGFEPAGGPYADDSEAKLFGKGFKPVGGPSAGPAAGPSAGAADDSGPYADDSEEKLLKKNGVQVVEVGKTNARKDPGEYWKYIMKEQPMPEAIRGLIRSNSVQSALDEKHKFPTFEETANKVKSFRPESGFWIYDKDNGLKEEKSFRKDLKPGSSLWIYDDDNGLKEEKPFVKDLKPVKPGSSLCIYDNDNGLKEKQFVKDLKPGASVWTYEDDNGLKE
ncbi:Organ specific protein [Dillenia turbinata]|uniref:Organ specific protein n=1 Tax=Dillenia turbinata TaxID=194707 RepID=A0AAN8W6M9_9MAGN